MMSKETGPLPKVVHINLSGSVVEVRYRIAEGGREPDLEDVFEGSSLPVWTEIVWRGAEVTCRYQFDSKDSATAAATVVRLVCGG
jgi:hypothetical protein